MTFIKTSLSLDNKSDHRDRHVWICCLHEKTQLGLAVEQTYLSVSFCFMVFQQLWKKQTHCQCDFSIKIEKKKIKEGAEENDLFLTT